MTGPADRETLEATARRFVKDWLNDCWAGTDMTHDLAGTDDALDACA